MAAIRMWRTDGVGWIRSFLHTASSWLRLGIGTTSSLQFSGMPAASLMSASLSSASALVSEVFSNTCLASLRRPCITSQRGDSGMAMTVIAKKIEGIVPIPSINRQPK